MHYSVLVGMSEPRGDIYPNPQSFRHREWTPQFATFDVFHHQVVGPDVVESADVRMIQ